MNERVGAIFDGMRIQSSPITKMKLMLRSDPNQVPKHGGHHHHHHHHHSDSSDDDDDDDCSFTTHRSSTTSNYYSSSADASPCNIKSSWVPPPLDSPGHDHHHFVDPKKNIFGLIGSIVLEEGHIYSLAVSGDLLYTGCDSKTVGVWRNLKEQSGFKSHSGLVKSIVLSGDRVFTGHQDGKIRVWRVLTTGCGLVHHKRVGSMPAFKDLMKTSIMKPATNIIVHGGHHTRKHSKYGMIKHGDAVSCLSLNQDLGLLYSGSWDRTIKVWRISDSECLESLLDAHDDYVNAIACGLAGGLVFTGSADGSVKAWRRDLQGLSTKHSLLQVLLQQESAVTSLAVEPASGWVYSGSSDGLVNFWEGVKNLAHGGTLKAHKMAVLCLAAGGTLVFSGSADKSICVWRRDDSGAHLLSSMLTGHTGPIKCLAIQEEEDEENQSWKVYSGSLDQSVKVWRVSHNQPGIN